MSLFNHESFAVDADDHTYILSTAEAAHHASVEPKPERPGLIRKLSQTFR